MTDFDKLADLAMLYVSEKEKEKAERDMQNIVAFADKISLFQGGEWEENLISPVSVSDLREDFPEKGILREYILSNSAEVKDGYISVPKSFKG